YQDLISPQGSSEQPSPQWTQSVLPKGATPGCEREPATCTGRPADLPHFDKDALNRGRAFSKLGTQAPSRRTYRVSPSADDDPPCIATISLVIARRSPGLSLSSCRSHLHLATPGSVGERVEHAAQYAPP